MANILTKQLGPLPLGVWLLAVGAGGGLAYALNRNRGEDEAVPVGIVDPFDQGALAGADGAVQLPAPIEDGGAGWATTPVEPSRPFTNAEWKQRAFVEMVARNIDAGVADAVLDKYLSGYSLTATEQGALSIALRYAGPPPEGAAPDRFEPLPEAPPLGPAPVEFERPSWLDELADLVKPPTTTAPPKLPPTSGTASKPPATPSKPTKAPASKPPAQPTTTVPGWMLGRPGLTVRVPVGAAPVTKPKPVKLPQGAATLDEINEVRARYGKPPLVRK